MGSSQTTYDVVVIGAGMAGASVAAELAREARVLLLEMESRPGYHSTGRSAAIFAPFYGPRPIRALTRASGRFFSAPPGGFADHALVSPRSILMVARKDQAEGLDEAMAGFDGDVQVQRLDGVQARAAMPLLREGYAVGGVLDNSGQDIDVAALHQGYLRRLRHEGGVLINDAGADAMQWRGGGWRVRAGEREFTAPVVVNAAGAWADRVGAMAGAAAVGLVAHRRSALMVAAPGGTVPDRLPLTIDIDEEFYLKPDAGRLLISPANADPQAPADAQPDEMDVAICVDRIERAFELRVARIESRWAGLRSFVADGVPVVGAAPGVPGFFWLAGQGGYGIQTAPALSRLAAALVLGREVPGDILDQGLDPAALAPDRPALSGASVYAG